jgi:hypothetical protein
MERRVTGTKVHHQTERGARIALAKRLISRASYEAILAGRLTLDDGKALGRDRGPDSPERQSGSETVAETPRKGRERLQEGTGAYCLCGCGELVKNRFRPGHDMRLYGELKRNLEKDPLLRNQRFNEEQREYARQRGLI